MQTRLSARLYYRVRTGWRRDEWADSPLFICGKNWPGNTVLKELVLYRLGRHVGDETDLPILRKLASLRGVASWQVRGLFHLGPAGSRRFSSGPNPGGKSGASRVWFSGIACQDRVFRVLNEWQ